jgi:hypothetical protein
MGVDGRQMLALATRVPRQVKIVIHPIDGAWQCLDKNGRGVGVLQMGTAGFIRKAISSLKP